MLENDRNKVQLLVKKQVYVYATFFHIYYRVKLYFDEKPQPYIVRQIGGFDVVFNVYSFVHIMSRHYYPDMNKGIGVSLNTDFGSINLDFLPEDMLTLIEKSNTQCPVTLKTEYQLFSIGRDYYILWLKYKRLNETQKEGFEVRSFYKCEEQRDLDKVQEPGICIVKIK